MVCVSMLEYSVEDVDKKECRPWIVGQLVSPS